MIKHLYFFRHAETQANFEQRLMGGGMDSSLTPKGIEDAKNFAAIVQKLPLDIVFSSSNLRAQKTAELLLQGKNLPLLITDELKEQSFGSMTGVLLKDIPQESDAAYRQDPYHFHHPGGESLADVKIRIGHFLHKIVQDDNYQHIGMVTHENVIRAAIAYMKHLDREVTVMKIAHCSLTSYFCDINQEFHALAISRTY